MSLKRRYNRIEAKELKVGQEVVLNQGLEIWKNDERYELLHVLIITAIKGDKYFRGYFKHFPNFNPYHNDLGRYKISNINSCATCRRN